MTTGLVPVSPCQCPEMEQLFTLHESESFTLLYGLYQLPPERVLIGVFGKVKDVEAGVGHWEVVVAASRRLDYHLMENKSKQEIRVKSGRAILERSHYSSPPLTETPVICQT